MKTLIIGSGAVGSVIAGYLARDGRDVTIADGWPQHVEAVRSAGLCVEPVEADFAVDVPAIHFDELASFGTADLVIIAGKSYDTRMLGLLAREHLHSRTIVMSAQNGMNDATLEGIVGSERVVACVVALGADLVEPGRVQRSSATDVTPVVLGHIAAGRDEARLERLGAHFAALGAVKTTNDVWPERWGKLTLNSMSNALAGLTGLRSNTMWTEPLTLDVIIALGHETASLAHAAGVAASPILGRIAQQTLLDAVSKSTPAWDDAADVMSQIGAERVGRKANRASLLQDVEKGRRTEIHYLNGWITTEGARLGVPTPTHEMIVTALRPVELGVKRPSLDNARDLAAAVQRWYAPRA